MSQHAGASVHRGSDPGARNLPAGMPGRGRKLKERFRVSEHPFGTVKFYDGAHYFLCKGKEKVAAETALMFTSYDIRRAISIAGGVQNLMKRMRAIKSQPKPQGILMPF